jgi:hypothetical protein
MRMTAREIFRHEGLDFNEWIFCLLNVESCHPKGRKKKFKTTELRRHQERFLQCLIDQVQQMTLAQTGHENELRRDLRS